MSTHSHPAVTSGECVLCDGPCKEPMQLKPVHENYPFLTPAQIAATQPQPPAEPSQRRAKRIETRPARTEDR